MKLKIFIIIILLLITGCKNKDVKQETEEKKEQVIDVEEYVDNNPIKIGIYENDIKLVKEYEVAKQNRKEIIFSFYYTNEENLGNSRQKENWNKFFNQYSNIENYKIGFNFSFYVGEEKIQKTILKPDTYAFNPYFYIYIYDDINQPDYTFYSHLEEKDINEKTIFSSLKILFIDPFPIKSPIEFTVFTYDSLDDFDENNNYRGNSKYTMNINLV